MSFKLSKIVILLLMVVLCLPMCDGNNEDSGNDGDSDTGGNNNPGGNSQSNQWSVGPYNIAFVNVLAVYSQIDDILTITFLQQIGSEYPMAVLGISNVANYSMGNDLFCAAGLTMSEMESYISDLTTEISFSRLELKSGGRISGSVTGRMWRVEDENMSRVDLNVNFKNVLIEII